MDSMRSLNTSLPSARRRPQPPAQLLQAFKTAALQVTNLYRAAATDREAAHEEGYQAALEDMLSFLDNENLGVSDGDGWRVRQWVTEKLQEGMASGNHIDSDDENTNPANQPDNSSPSSSSYPAKPVQRSSSPAVQRPAEEPPVPAAAAAAAARAAPPPPPSPPSVSPEPVVHIATTTSPDRPAFDPAALPKADFTFRATQQLQQSDLDMDRDPEVGEDNDDDSGSGAAVTSPINVFPRHHPRHHHHHHHHRAANGIARSNHARENGRGNPAATAAAVAQINGVGQGAGLKRRAPFQDFFDITGVGSGKDGFGGGGGKRGRFT